MIRNIVILTGAGVSAESGIDTFRSEGGLWEKHRVEDVATPEAYARDPDLVLRFYDMRREAIQTKQPNAAHLALGRLDAEWAKGEKGELLIVTQNVDDLHERGGAARLLHMHGEHLNAWCTACDARPRWTGPMIDRPPCPDCGTAALRPDVVWFGEMPYHMDRIHATCSCPSAPRERSIRRQASCGKRAIWARARWSSIWRNRRVRAGSMKPGSARRARLCQHGWRNY